MLRVSGASRRIDDRPILTNVDLALRKGTICGLVGPNGAGKSSLLRAITGWLRLDTGTITIDGLSPTEARRRGRLGVVPQEIALYPHLTVRENLGVLGRLAGLPLREVPARVTEGLAWAGLTDRAESLPPALSGGMRRRVNLVASTLHHPALLLLDEPTVGVDAAARVRLHDLLRTLRAREVAVVIVTHDPDEAAVLCDEVAVMHGGRLIARDRTASLIAAAVGTTREVTLKIGATPGPAGAAVLAAHGFDLVADGTWVSTTVDSLARLEAALASAGVRATEARLSEPTLAGAIAALTHSVTETAR